VLTGGGGDDVLYGGGGDDVFDFSYKPYDPNDPMYDDPMNLNNPMAFGDDRIMDFSDSDDIGGDTDIGEHDVIDLSGRDLQFSDLGITANGLNVEITVGGDGTITLVDYLSHYNIEDLNADDFMF